jgi:hypothetical protein
MAEMLAMHGAIASGLLALQDVSSISIPVGMHTTAS